MTSIKAKNFFASHTGRRTSLAAAWALAAVTAGSLVACTEQPDGEPAELVVDENKDGSAQFEFYANDDFARTYRCDEWFSCDIQVRVKRCNISAPLEPFKTLGTLKIASKDTGLLGTVAIRDAAEDKLFSSVASEDAASYRVTIDPLSSVEEFELWYTPDDYEGEGNCLQLIVGWQ